MGVFGLFLLDLANDQLLVLQFLLRRKPIVDDLVLLHRHRGLAIIHALRALIFYY